MAAAAAAAPGANLPASLLGPLRAAIGAHPLYRGVAAPGATYARDG